MYKIYALYAYGLVLINMFFFLVLSRAVGGNITIRNGIILLCRSLLSCCYQRARAHELWSVFVIRWPRLSVFGRRFVIVERLLDSSMNRSIMPNFDII